MSHAQRALVNRLRYKHLHLLAALGETRNLHQTALRLSLSQPAATRMLQEVETTFGFSLFERTHRGMHPTPVGDELIDFAQMALARLEHFSRQLSRFSTGGEGQLLIGTIMGAAPDIVVSAIVEFKTRWPRLQLSLMGETSDQVLALLEQGQIDLAVARLSPGEVQHSFTFEPLGNERLLALVRPQHRLAQVDGLPTLERLLRDYTWVLQPRTSPSRSALEQGLQRAGLSSPTQLIECSSVFAALNLALRSDCIVVLPEAVVRDHLELARLFPLALQLGETMAPFGVLTRADDRADPRRDEFIALLRSHAGQLITQPL